MKTIENWFKQYLKKGIDSLNSFQYKPKKTYLTEAIHLSWDSDDMLKQVGLQQTWVAILVQNPIRNLHEVACPDLSW